MTALGTWSAMVSRTMLKYDEMSRRMSSVSRASRSVSSGSCAGIGGYTHKKKVNGLTLPKKPCAFGLLIGKARYERVIRKDLLTNCES